MDVTDNTMHTLADNERYNYFLQRCKDNRQFWLLQAREELFAMFEDGNGQEYIPVWPDKEYAIMYSKDDWEDYRAVSMGWKEFENWLDELKSDQVHLAVFPNDQMQVIPLTPEMLKEHLEMK